jgi:hypothetical protein
MVAFGGLTPQAQTPVAGFALQDATPTILTWNVPDDGNLHYFLVYAILNVSSPETGGQVIIKFTDPSGAAHTFQLLAAGLSGENAPAVLPLAVESGSTVSVAQNSALSAGAATLWAAIFGL